LLKNFTIEKVGLSQNGENGCPDWLHPKWAACIHAKEDFLGGLRGFPEIM